ncbi:flagellar M-ring protein FliF [Marivita sp. S6314]|uniref:flagellar basal-body MS-ring/collar protein FliF n=1 Tax=Marivita sp. S6314 TaxID=2926406 RepID=UPI001FF17CBA|nr:flagellar M-ring protein FliF [Marivita sp. S6314]
MQQLLPIWRSMSMARKAIVIGATLAIFVAILGMSRLATQPRLTLLYSGLDPAAAGEVVQNLQQSGVAYDVRGASVFVDAAQRDQLRLTLASEGLPASGSQGYELLDSLTGFGTTSQMFDATYLRAKEGELARTIVSSPDIATARVHIATGSDNPFRRDLMSSASVYVTGRSGVVNAAQAQAFRHLVASAVAGLSPDSVSIVDAQAGLLPGDNAMPGVGNEFERTEQLREKVLRLIEARVGRGNAVVEVSLDAITDTESITEKRFDPSSRIVISSDTEERTDQSENAGSGAVSVASNLPDGDANTSETETSQSSETRERLNYEVSQTTRELIKAPGAIKRLTVAVLLNGEIVTDAQGNDSFVPMPDTEIDALRDLVASAVGYDEARGDVITLRSMPLEVAPLLGTPPAAAPWYAASLDAMTLVQMAVLAIVTLVLGLFVLRPLLLSNKAPAAASVPALTASDVDTPAATPVLTGTIEPDGPDVSLPVLAELQSADPGQVPSTEDAVNRLKNLIEERRSETVEVLRSWLDDPKTGGAR